jgi:endonuclease-3
MNQELIGKILIKQGKQILRKKRSFVEFTGNSEADRLLNDLNIYPHAFVIASIMDRQIGAKRAWLIPYRFSIRLGRGINHDPH